MSDSAEKTEKATPKKMKKVRQEGGIQKSQDLTGWISLAAAAAMIPLVGSTAWEQARYQFSQVKDLAGTDDVNRAIVFIGSAMWSVIPTVLPLMLGVLVVAVIVNIIQGRGVFPSLKKLKPKLQNFNLVKGAKRVFGLQALWNGAKALLKTSAVGVVLYFVIASMRDYMGLSGRLDIYSLLGIISGKLWLLIWASVVAGIALSFLDALFIFKKNQKQTKMSKQEIKEEYKSTEGNPEIKGARRARQMQMSRNRMMADAAEADVVVVNPTHYAVALKYNPAAGAPKVVAKGVDNIASKLREIALDNTVPQVQDVALARALYATCEVGEEIPEELYTTVAQVLAFVMMLKRRGAAKGVHKLPVVA